MLLSGLGVRDQVFVERFEKYFAELQNIETSAEISMKYLIMQNEMQVATSLMTDGFTQEVKKRVNEIVALELEKIHKLRAVIEKARNVFGCADPISQLQYGEVFNLFHF